MGKLLTCMSVVLGLGALTGAAQAAADQWTVAEPAALAAQPLNSEGEGRRLYLKLNCYSCHGMYGGGGMGPNVVRAEKGDVSEAVLRGEDHGMPSFKNYVTSRDITNLAAYLRSIGGANEPKFMDWWVKIPPK
jgi:mono/diheme cytochrome c family protein